MPGIIKSKQDLERQDKELVKKIKPQLKKFVINMQRNKAAETAKEQKVEMDLLLSNTEAIKRASELATKSMIHDRIWQKIPPYFEMKWLQRGATTPELIQEMNVDISGFATYLLREYNNYFKYKALKRGYLNPLNEDNILFFWQKMQSDLALLMAGERLRTQKGNKPIITAEDTAPAIITDISKLKN